MNETGFPDKLMTELGPQHDGLHQVARKAPRLVFQVMENRDDIGLDRDRTSTWEEFADLFSRPRFLGKDSLAKYRKDSAAISEGELPDEIDDWICPETIAVQSWRPLGPFDPANPGPRSDQLRIHAIVFDVERNMPLQQVKTSLAGIEALVHSTYRNCSADNRWRVIIPLRSAIGGKDWATLLEHFQSVFKGRLGDIYSHNPSHWFRLPACPSDAAEQYTMMRLDGEVFDGLWGAAAASIKRGERGSRIAKYDPSFATATSPKEDGNTAAETVNLTDLEQMHEAKDAIAKAMQIDVAESKKVAAQPAEVTESSTPTVTASLAVAAITTPDKAPLPTLPIMPQGLEVSIAPSCSVGPTAELPETPDSIAVELLADYGFPPGVSIGSSSLTDAALMETLDAMVIRVKVSDDYLGIRDSYCETVILLNHRGLWAPAFRPELKIPLKKSDLRPVHTLIQRDRVVIDCHWLHSTAAKVKAHEPRSRAIFKAGTPFPFDLASEFAEQNMANEYRADAVLNLSDFQQCQMRALRGRFISSQFAAFRDCPRVEGVRVQSPRELLSTVINRWCEKTRQMRGHEEKYMAHAQARALLVRSSPTSREVATLAGMIRGVPRLGDSTVRDLLKNLDRKMATAT